MLYGLSYFDVIQRIDGSREIVFSTPYEKEAVDFATDIYNNDNNAKVYVAKNTVTTHKIEREIIDPFDAYESYSIDIDFSTEPQKKAKKKHKNARDIKKTYHFS